MKEIITIFKDYNGIGYYCILFLAALLFLWFTEKDRYVRYILIYAATAIQILFFVPPFKNLISVVMEEVETYYRILWLLPMTIVIAYSAVKVVGKHTKVGLAVLTVILILSGQFVYQNINISKAENAYHLPQNVIEVCNMIMPEDGKERVRAVFPAEMLHFVRQYTTEIMIPYGRDMLVPDRTNGDHPLYALMEAPEISAEQLAAMATEYSCNYVVLRNDKPVNGVLTDYGFEKIGEVGVYLVYQNTAVPIYESGGVIEDTEETKTETNESEQTTSQEVESEISTQTEMGTTTEEPKEMVEDVQTAVFAGKKLSILGDSISTFTGYIPENYSLFYPENGTIFNVEETWWKQLLNQTGMVLCRNASYSGALCAGNTTDTQDARCGASDKRIADLMSTDGSSPDLIIVFIGINDYLTDVPMGSFQGIDTLPGEGVVSTFCDGYGVMLRKVKNAYPNAAIYCCTITETIAGDKQGEGVAPGINNNGNTIEDFNNSIKVVAAAFGATILDTHSCGITYENAMTYTGDGLHPNPAGASLIYNVVSKSFQVN